MNRLLLFLFLGVALAVPIFGSVAPLVVTTPASSAVFSGNQNINITFSGTANVTILYNSTGVPSFVILNYSNNQTGTYNFTWQTNNGTFPDGIYNLSILAINSTNFSDNQTASITSITIDNTAPLAENVTSLPNVTSAGVQYVNATPVIVANITDALSGIATCEYSRNSTDPFGQGSIMGNASAYPLIATCKFAPGDQNDGTVFNFTFRATDLAGNIGQNATRIIFVVDANPPTFVFNTPNMGAYHGGQNILIDANVIDTSSNITNNTDCGVEISTGTGSFIGGVNYSNTTGKCFGNITLKTVGGPSEGTHTLSLTLADRVGNQNSTSITILIDNTPPSVFNLTISNHHPATDGTLVNFTVNVTDSLSVANVTLSNGTFSKFFSLIAGNSSNGTYRLQTNLSDFNCQNESICGLNVTANDTLGNLNNTMQIGTSFNLLYIDAYPPMLLSNATNVSSARTAQDVLFSAQWSDISFADNNATARLTIYDSDANQFLPPSSSSYSLLSSSNWTNFTYNIEGWLEGRQLIARITLNDSIGHTNITGNLTLIVQNGSIIVSILSPANNSAMSQNTTLLFAINQTGAGINWTVISINVTGSANYSLSIVTNASLFTCHTDYNDTSYLENATCAVQGNWRLDNNATFTVHADALAGYSNFTSSRFIVTNEAPDIVNLSVNGQVLAQNSTPPGIAATVSGSTVEMEFNWSTQSSYTVDSAGISFLNVSPSLAHSFGSIPVSTRYNMTAGKNYLLINATVGALGFTDTVQLNLTANVPLNVTAIANGYDRSIVNSFTVTLAGQDITANGSAFVNGTLDVSFNVTNDTGTPLPFTAQLNFTGLNGLSLRWNASPAAFTILPGSAGDFAAASTAANANVTLLIKSKGQNLFFDSQRYRLIVTINLSMANRSAYFQRDQSGNGSSNKTYLLTACAAAPAGIIQDASSCYVNQTNTTVVYLSRFEDNDQLFFADPTNAPNVTLAISAALNQSVIPLLLRAITPIPSAAFCSYNISNVSGGIAIAPAVTSITLSQFSLQGSIWSYGKNITGIADGNYSIVANCTDTLGRSAIDTKNITVADVTPPTISNISVITGVTSATVSASTDEFATYTVNYGTDAGFLNNTASNATLALVGSVSLTKLAPDTTYYYNFVVCDVMSHCRTVPGGAFLTGLLDSSTGGSSGSGGGGLPEKIAGAVETSDTRSWTSVAQGTTISYLTRNNVTFTNVTIHFNQFVDFVKVGIKQFKTKPSDIPDAGLIYKYLYIENQGLDAVDSRSIGFAVPKQWLSDNQIPPDGIALYRLENGAWKPYVVTRAGETATAYTYAVSLPGFSYFAVGKLAAQAPPPASQNVTGPVSQPVQAPVTSANSTQNGTAGEITDFIVHKTASSGFPEWMVIVIVCIVLLLAVVTGMFQYKRYLENSGMRHAQLQSDREQEQRRRQLQDVQARASVMASQPRTEEHDPMAPVHKYIGVERKRGLGDDEIRKRLVAGGWDPVIVDMELLRKD